MGMTDERLPRQERMQTRWEFHRVQRDGSVSSGKYLVVGGLRTQDGQTRRVGFIVSKRVGNAVVRNRIKRWLREVYRRQRVQVAEGTQLVVIARGQARHARHDELEKEFLHLLQPFLGGS